jgi:hypothetical protein
MVKNSRINKRLWAFCLSSGFMQFSWRWLRDVANEMDLEDGVIWVYAIGEDGALAFTDFGMEVLIEPVRSYKQTRAC